ncbi:hypothetical protein EVA_05322 [gut metagenome]|uniref:Uncharacterized protein n=1 Tax=gut metagenome TaxID=749906 RepID=J9GUT7_9ZZZZ
MVFDQAQLGAMYQLKFRKDSTKVNDYTEAQTVLMISDNYLLFGDYNRLAFDSINDYLAANSSCRCGLNTENWIKAHLLQDFVY